MVRLDRLATGIQLGDGRPSHLLSQLQQTNATNDESVVRRYWIKRLPPPARAVNVSLLESSPNTTLAQLATAAESKYLLNFILQPSLRSGLQIG